MKDEAVLKRKERKEKKATTRTRVELCPLDDLSRSKNKKINKIIL